MKVSHLTSRIQKEPAKVSSRSDSCHFYAQGVCRTVPKCPVKYKFYIKHIPHSNENYISFDATKTSADNHENETKRVTKD